MRKSTALKTLWRSPPKALLTFLLIAAASFALFSRVTDYVVTMREIACAESFCRGVAALDNTSSTFFLKGAGSGMVSDYTAYELTGAPWPSESQLAEFSSLPGVALADTRYMTAGLVEDYKRLADTSSNLCRFVLEGVYAGCEYSESTGVVELSFDAVSVLASDREELDVSRPVQAIGLDDQTYYDNPYPADYFAKLKKGSRCLVIGFYDAFSSRLRMDMGAEAFQILDGLGDGYLETEAFASQKGIVEAIQQSAYTYDMVYTSDMRAIPRFNEHSMAIAKGRFLEAGDRDACVVNTLFLDAHGLSVGDWIHVKLGDRLFHQKKGAQARSAEEISGIAAQVELEIVGAYQNLDDSQMRRSEPEWSYSDSAIFVPSSLLPVEVPKDYEAAMGEFSLLVARAQDIESFREAAEPLVAEMGIPMRFSDGGWLSMKDSFEAGRRTAVFTALLSVVGAALALLLAVCLYIGRSRQSYAIMRTLGVPGRKAQDAVLLPFLLLSALAVPAGGAAGLIYTSAAARSALESMASHAPDGYLPNAAIPPSAAVWCLLLELAFLFTVTLLFLWRMKKTPPLELLQEGAGQGVGRKRSASGWERAGGDCRDKGRNQGAEPVPVGINMERISDADKIRECRHGKYRALRQVPAYILRHMRRGIGKSAVSFGLAAVLAAGMGTFVLARLTYRDAACEMDVKGRALSFASSNIPDLQESELIDDFYCYHSFEVCVNDMKTSAPITFTNDIGRYLGGECKIAYGAGYDDSFLEGKGALCLLGKALAEELGVHAGDQVEFLLSDIYAAMAEVYQEEGELQRKVHLKARKYTVAGIIESDAQSVQSGIFAPPNRAMEDIYNPPFAFPFTYCEFTLADNERVEDVEIMLEDMKNMGKMDAPTASFYIDTAGLMNIRRICGLLDSLFPVAVAAALLVSLFGPGLVVLQSAREAAFWRVLGVTKKRTRCMLVLEQAALCIAGIAFVAGGLLAYNAEKLARGAETLAACWALYFLGCVCGAAAVSIQVTRRKVLELLQVKE